MEDVITSAPDSTETPATEDNTENESQESGGVIDPSENKPKADPAPDPLRSTKHKIKANGKEIELDYDSLLKKAELGEGAYQRFEEATKKEKEAEMITKKIMSGKIEELLDVVPLDRLLEITSQIEKTRLELQGLSQKEIDDLLYYQEAEAAKAQLKQIEEEKAAAIREQESLKAFHIIEAEIGDVLEEAKAQGVPLADLPDVGIEVVEELLRVLELVESEERAGRQYRGKIPTAKDIFEQIQSRYQSRLDTYLQKHSPDKLLKKLTPEQQKALRQASLDTLYGDSPRPGSFQTPSDVQVQASPYSKRMTTDEYFKQKELQLGARR